jgi:hypothetical protein
MIYICIASLIGILSFVEITSKTHRVYGRKLALVFVFITLLLTASLRFEVGDDWHSYIGFYTDRDLSQNVEFGYRLINDFFSDLGLPYNLFLLLINSVALFFTYKFIYLNAKSKQIGLLIFFYDIFFYLYLSGFRQAIALSVICIGFSYAFEKRLLKYLLVVLLASTFHKSALIALPIYFIPRNSFILYSIFKSIKFYLVLFVIIFISYVPVEFFLELIEDSFFKNINYYLLSHYKAENIEMAYVIGLVKRSIAIFFYILYRRYLPRDNLTHYFFNVYLIGFLIFLGFYLLSPDLATRLSLYFTIFEILIIGNLVYYIPRFKDKFLVFITYIAVTAIKLFDYMNRDSYQYHSILSNII